MLALCLPEFLNYPLGFFLSGILRMFCLRIGILFLCLGCFVGVFNRRRNFNGDSRCIRAEPVGVGG